jgi:hypothetical protein
MLRAIDFFPKLKDDSIVKRTTAGGVLTAIACVIIAIIFIDEAHDFLFNTSLDTSVGVDTSRNESIRVNLDIHLPALPCGTFGLDFIDIDGDQSIEIDLKTVQMPTGCRVLGRYRMGDVMNE